MVPGSSREHPVPVCDHRGLFGPTHCLRGLLVFFTYVTLVHVAHCCAKHGCKYAHADCPVANDDMKQEHPCEFCEMDDEDAAPEVGQ